jgi:hypothetical protein
MDPPDMCTGNVKNVKFMVAERIQPIDYSG